MDPQALALQATSSEGSQLLSELRAVATRSNDNAEEISGINRLIRMRSYLELELGNADACIALLLAELGYLTEVEAYCQGSPTTCSHYDLMCTLNDLSEVAFMCFRPDVRLTATLSTLTFLSAEWRSELHNGPDGPSVTHFTQYLREMAQDIRLLGYREGNPPFDEVAQAIEQFENHEATLTRTTAKPSTITLPLFGYDLYNAERQWFKNATLIESSSSTPCPTLEHYVREIKAATQTMSDLAPHFRSTSHFQIGALRSAAWLSLKCGTTDAVVASVDEEVELLEHRIVDGSALPLTVMMSAIDIQHIVHQLRKRGDRVARNLVLRISSQWLSLLEKYAIHGQVTQTWVRSYAFLVNQKMWAQNLTLRQRRRCESRQILVGLATRIGIGNSSNENLQSYLSASLGEFYDTPEEIERYVNASYAVVPHYQIALLKFVPHLEDLVQ